MQRMQKLWVVSSPNGSIFISRDHSTHFKDVLLGLMHDEVGEGMSSNKEKVDNL